MTGHGLTHIPMDSAILMVAITTNTYHCLLQGQNVGTTGNWIRVCEIAILMAIFYINSNFHALPENEMAVIRYGLFRKDL